MSPGAGTGPSGDDAPPGEEGAATASGEGRLPPGTARWVYGAAALGTLGVLLYSMRPVLSPLVLFVLFVYLIWPLSESRLRARLLVATSVLLVLWTLHVTGLLLAPFILALILAYMLDPVVGWLEERRLPRPAGIAVLSLPVLGILALIVFVLAPAVGEQISQFISNVPGYVDAVEEWLRTTRTWLVGLQIAGINDQTLPELGRLDAETVARYLRRWQAEVTAAGAGAVLGLGRGVGTVLTVLGYVVLTPILTYYLLRDWPRLRERLVDLVPPARRDPVLRFTREFDDLLARYLRGQVLLAIIVGLLVGVGFWIVDFPFALLLGIVAGVLNVVPYLGLIGSAAVAIIIALFSGAIASSLLKIVLVLGVEQLVEGVVAPKIVGESVGLHPVWVLLALVLFSFFFGFVGVLIAVPAAVFLKLVAVRAVNVYRGSRYFGAAPETEGARKG